MTAIRALEEQRTILDFSYGKCSRNKIRQSLNSCYLTSLDEHENDGVTLYNNTIKVGMYNIEIKLPFDLVGPRKLKEFRDFEIAIYDSHEPNAKPIDLKRDQRFRNQDWVGLNFFGKLRVKHMVEIIAHCQRLNRLKAFL